MRDELKVELLKMARELQSEQLPRFFGDLEEIMRTAEVHAAAIAQVQQPDELLDIKQASALTKLSTDSLYRHEYAFTRRSGRKRLFSRLGITLAIQNNDLQPLLTHGNVTHSKKIQTKARHSF